MSLCSQRNLAAALAGLSLAGCSWTLIPVLAINNKLSLQVLSPRTSVSSETPTDGGTL